MFKIEHSKLLVKQKKKVVKLIHYQITFKSIFFVAGGVSCVQFRAFFFFFFPSSNTGRGQGRF